MDYMPFYGSIRRYSSNMKTTAKLFKIIVGLCAYELFLIGMSHIISTVSKTYDMTGNYMTRFIVFGNTIMISFVIMYISTMKVVCNTLWKRYLKAVFQLTAAVTIGSFLGFKILLFGFWFDYSEFEMRNIVATNVLIALFLSGIALLRIAYLREKRTIELEYQKHKVETQLLMTQSKLKPHFLFNTLTGLIKIGYEKDPEKLESVIRKMTKMYRNIIDMPNNADICLEEEMSLIEDYLNLEKCRLGDRLNYTINIQEDCLLHKIPPLLIEVLVENAVIHGISPKQTGGEIAISVTMTTSNMLRIEVSDNGIGFDPESGNIGFGVGSIYSRLKNKYGDSGKMMINSKPSVGTTITMEVPV